MKRLGGIVVGVLATLCVLAPLAMAGGNGVGSGGLNGFPASSSSSSSADTSTAFRFVSTAASTGTSADGGANFSCPNNVATSSPCLANPRDSLEIGGYMHTTPQDDSDFSVLVGALLDRDGGAVLDVMNGFGGSETKVLRVMANGDLRMWGSFLRCNQQTSSNGCRVLSPNGGIYLVSTSGEVLVENDAAGTVMSWYGGAGPTLAGSLADTGALDLRTGPSSNSCTLDGASPSKCAVTTFANAKCVCSVISTAGAAPCTVNLVTTTLTAYSSNGLTNDVNVECH